MTEPGCRRWGHAGGFADVDGHVWGRRLFEHATDMPRLELVEATPSRSGVVLLTYRPA